VGSRVRAQAAARAVPPLLLGRWIVLARRTPARRGLLPCRSCGSLGFRARLCPFDRFGPGRARGWLSRGRGRFGLSCRAAQGIGRPVQRDAGRCDRGRANRLPGNVAHGIGAGLRSAGHFFLRFLHCALTNHECARSVPLRCVSVPSYQSPARAGVPRPFVAKKFTNPGPPSRRRRQGDPPTPLNRFLPQLQGCLSVSTEGAGGKGAVRTTGNLGRGWIAHWGVPHCGRP
jgi:hypothetical protein